LPYPKPLWGGRGERQHPYPFGEATWRRGEGRRSEGRQLGGEEG